MRTLALVSCFAAGVLAIAGAPGLPRAASRPSPVPVQCHTPRALDGDTIRCRNLSASVRLLGIDAPELPGHCRTGRACVAGDPFTSRAALAALLRSGRVTVELIGTDRWNRNLAVVHVLGWTVARPVNLSCAQIASGRAVYVPAWDNGQRIARECGL